MGVDYSIRYQAGYQLDQLDWNISGSIDGLGSPNILSELRWENLDVFMPVWVGSYYLIYVYIRGQLARGNITSGKNQDSDYCNDNRTGEFSRSNNQSRGYLDIVCLV